MLQMKKGAANLSWVKQSSCSFYQSQLLKGDKVSSWTIVLQSSAIFIQVRLGAHCNTWQAGLACADHGLELQRNACLPHSADDLPFFRLIAKNDRLHSWWFQSSIPLTHPLSMGSKRKERKKNWNIVKEFTIAHSILFLWRHCRF